MIHGFADGDKRKKIFLIGGLLLLAGLIYRFFPSEENWFPSEDDISLSEKRITAYQRKIVEEEGLDTLLVESNRTLAVLESGMLAGETSALAAVDIQNTIQEITRMYGIEVNTMQVLPSVEIGGGIYRTIPVQFTFQSTATQLANIVYRLSTSQKLLVPESLRVVNSNQQKEGLIQTTLTVTGLMKKKADS